MNGSLFAVGAVVTALVFGAIALLVYGAMLDGRPQAAEDVLPDR